MPLLKMTRERISSDLSTREVGVFLGGNEGKFRGSGKMLRLASGQILVQKEFLTESWEYTNVTLNFQEVKVLYLRQE